VIQNQKQNQKCSVSPHGIVFQVWLLAESTPFTISKMAILFELGPNECAHGDVKPNKHGAHSPAPARRHLHQYRNSTGGSYYNEMESDPEIALNTEE
jgi:hypothetical protein